jgi:hypothetical protein
VRNHIRQLIEDARRSGDRVGVDGPHDTPSLLAAETIRLARLATSIHLAEAARQVAASEPASDRSSSVRERVR